MDLAIPTITSSYQAMVAELEAGGADVEAIYDALDRLRSAVVVEADRMESATRRSA